MPRGLYHFRKDMKLVSASFIYSFKSGNKYEVKFTKLDHTERASYKVEVSKNEIFCGWIKVQSLPTTGNGLRALIKITNKDIGEL